MTLNEDGTYQTSDLALAGALFSLGAKLLTVDRTNPRRALFVFNKEREMDAISQAYWMHQLQVDPLAYFAALKELKCRLYEPDIEH